MSFIIRGRRTDIEISENEFEKEKRSIEGDSSKTSPSSIPPKPSNTPPGGDSGVEFYQEKNDIAEALKELNEDKLDATDKLSPIDLKTRLTEMEISSLIALDSLVSFNFLPPECSIISRSKKRLAVSLRGKGREEIVNITNGVRDKDEQNKSMMEKFGDFFSGKGGGGK